jgi:glycosyltransferase involved in cell wall biosynthesis
MVRLLTFTTLYPNEASPNHGVFVENRLRHLVAGGAVRSTVLAPVPFFPSGSARFGRWARQARVPHRERRHGLDVYHPRYLVIPRFGMSLAPWLLYAASLRAARRLMAAGVAFDLIDAHYFYPDGVAAVWLGRSLGLPVVVTARGSDVTQFPGFRIPRALLRRAVTEADAMISVSGALKTALVGLGAAPGKVEVLRNGVNAAQFRPVERSAVRDALGLRRPTLLSVGHLIERKGHHRVIEALRLLPDYELLVAGEGSERDRLEALAEACGVAERVRLLGARPHAELPSLYSAADMLVLASSREGWANVLLEAMACGTPVVASPIPGNPEVVQESVAGVIAPANTPEGIAAGVRLLAANLPDRSATRAYAERFSWDATTEGQLRLFRRLLVSRPGAGFESAPMPLRTLAAADAEPGA